MHPSERERGREGEGGREGGREGAREREREKERESEREREHVHACTSARARTHAHIHTHMHACMHTHTHTHTHTQEILGKKHLHAGDKKQFFPYREPKGHTQRCASKANLFLLNSCEWKAIFFLQIIRLFSRTWSLKGILTPRVECGVE